MTLLSTSRLNIIERGGRITVSHLAEEDKQDDEEFDTDYVNGNIVCESWWCRGTLHRLDLPARIEYYEDGKTKSEHWMLNGATYTGSPEFRYYDREGKLSEEPKREPTCGYHHCYPSCKRLAARSRRERERKREVEAEDESDTQADNPLQ